MAKLLGGNFTWINGGYRRGTSTHSGQSWKERLAWDIAANPGQNVYSAVNGVVTSKESPRGVAGHRYGTYVTIRGNSGAPEVFYSNLQGVRVDRGSRVRVGDKIGEVASAPSRGDSFLHFAVSNGDISSVVESDGTLVYGVSSSNVSDVDAGDVAAGAGAAALTDDDKKNKKKKSEKPEEPDDMEGKPLIDKVSRGLAKVLLPFGLVSGIAGLAEEVKRMKELMK